MSQDNVHQYDPIYKCQNVPTSAWIGVNTQKGYAAVIGRWRSARAYPKFPEYWVYAYSKASQPLNFTTRYPSFTRFLHFVDQWISLGASFVTTVWTMTLYVPLTLFFHCG